MEIAEQDKVRFKTLTADTVTEKDFKKIYAFCYRSDHGELKYQETYLEQIEPLVSGEVIEAFKKWRLTFEQAESETLKNISIPSKVLTTVIDGSIVPKETKRINLISAAELLKMDIPPLEWLVDGLLPKGSVGVVVAPPKSYKSYLCIDLGVSICNGDKFLGRKTNAGEIVYLDLESTKRRPRDRLLQVLGKNRAIPSGFYLLTSENDVGRIDDGFEGTINQIFESHNSISLLVIDVFQLIRRKQGRSQNAYDFDYADIGAIKKIADAYHTSILLVHHTRKMRDLGDAFNNASGSTAILGAVDFMWMIEREKREDDFATLHITGRDIESVDLRVRFNKDSFRWEYVGTEFEVKEQERRREYEESSIIKTIKSLLSTHGGEWKGSASEIKSASKYMGAEIHDDASKIGRTIVSFGDLLKADYITFTQAQEGKERKRIYSFICSQCS
ncbi:MAG: AAA family ATPase [Bacteroidales bacterium]|nr:AAA family ATPase [Bacteroidales bacterium]